jgi:hypothetical protein
MAACKGWFGWFPILSPAKLTSSMYKSMGRAPSFIHPSLESINIRRHNVARREKSSIHILAL